MFQIGRQEFSNLVLLGGLILGPVACSKKRSDTDLPIIRNGSGTESIVEYVPRGAMLRHLAPVLSKTADLTTGKLEKYENNPKMNLTRISFGLELEPSFGIEAGPIEAKLKLEAALEVRLERLPFPGEAINPGI